MIFLINTFIGFLIAQIADILKRDRASYDSPKRLNLWFFLKDTWVKIVLSLALSVTISLAVWLNIKDLSSLFGQEWIELNNIVYVVIGVAPELVLQYFRNKYGFLKPTRPTKD